MRASHAALLLFLGAFAVVYAYTPSPQDREAKLAEVTRILAVTRRDAAADSRQSEYAFRSFAPAAGSLATATPPAAAPDRKGEPKLVSGPARVSRVVVPAATTGSWSAVVTADPQARAKPSPLTRLKAVKPSSDAARYELVRDLQSELKRVGCFSGDVSGAWGAATKAAMTAFTERVNARLPIEEPDYVLLALLKSHNAKACGDACPYGQLPSESGRCLPKAVLAQLEKKRAAQEKRLAALAAKTATASSWTTVTSAEPQPGKAAPVAVVAAPAEAPLPGRMSIGGPRAVAAPAVVPPAPVEATRVAAIDDASTAPDATEARPPAVTDSAPAPRAKAQPARRAARPARSYRGRYVPPPPYMVGSFYHDKPAYNAGWRRY